MSIYGYAKKRIGTEGLLELSEVTFDVSTADLRRIARFMLEFADQVEAGAYRSSHRHLGDFDRLWNSDHPRSDVILIHPCPDPPKLVSDE